MTKSGRVIIDTVSFCLAHTVTIKKAENFDLFSNSNMILYYSLTATQAINENLLNRNRLS